MSKETPAMLHIEDVATLRSELATIFGYTMYYDDFNQIRIIHPRIANKTLDKFLELHSDEIVLNSSECEELYELFMDIRSDDEDIQGDIYRLIVVLNSASASKNSLKINNTNGECKYVSE